MLSKKLKVTSPPQFIVVEHDDGTRNNPKRKRKKYRFLSYQKHYGSFWFRIFGYGLVITDRTKHQPLFSERMGITKTLRIGKYAIKFLKPFKH